VFPDEGEVSRERRRKRNFDPNLRRRDFIFLKKLTFGGVKMEFALCLEIVAQCHGRIKLNEVTESYAKNNRITKYV